MAELEVVTRYKSLPARTILSILVLLMPFWGVLAPLVLCVGLFYVTTNFSGMGPQYWLTAIGMGLGLLIIMIVGVLSTLAFADDRIIATRAGLKVPFFLSFGNMFKRNIAWSDVGSLQLIGSENDKLIRLRLRVALNKGRHVDIYLGKLKEAEVEQLLIATQLWCTQSIRDNKLDLLQTRLQDSSGSAEPRLSYTSMWEEELERRFAATAFVPLEPGVALQNGRLKVVRQLSFGGLSAIYLCQDSGKELVVLKESVIPSESREEIRAKAEELFAREARFLMRLKHEQIVNVLDFFVEAGRNYMLLEYINGQDLRQFVKQHGRCSELTAVQWLIQVCDILSYLHQQEPPVIHRDLTPDNIVLREDGTLKLIDFGAANELIGTATGTLVGKQAFISPEQLRGKATIASDIYALGCTMHYLLTGEDPEPLSVSSPAALRPDLDSALNTLVEQCTQMDATLRPASALQVKEQALLVLKNLQSGTGVTI